MKKILIAIFVLIIIGVGTYLFYSSKSSEYKLSLDSEVNYADRHFENLKSENAKLYWKENNSFSVNTGTFKDGATASAEIARLVTVYNPAKINLNGKYVYYKDQGIYFYQSGSKVLLITSSAAKDATDSFIIWLTNKQYKPI